MIEYPKTYEEAKVIIKNSVGDQVNKRYKKINLLRSSLIALIAYGAAATIGLVNHSALVGLAAVPLATTVTIMSCIPIFFQKSIDKKIKNGSYFYGKSEEEIMRIARRHVAEYNEIEQSKKSK